MKLNLTEEQKKINNHNKYKAMQHFNLQKGYVLHHVDESLRHNDIERYIEWRPEDLVVMELGEHSRFHNKGRKHSEESKRKMSKSVKQFHKEHPGFFKGERNPMYGKHPETWIKGKTKETDERVAALAKKLSESKKGIQPKHWAEKADNCKGSKWYTNGVNSIRLKTDDIIPEGYYPGRLYKRSR